MIKKIKYKSIIFIGVILSLSFLCYVFRNNRVLIPLDNFILNTSPKDKFKDLINVTITVMAVFVGFMATIGTLFIGLTEKRTVKIINQYGKGGMLVRLIKSCIYTGIMSILILALLYTLSDVYTNTLILKIIIIFLISCVFLFLKYSLAIIRIISYTLKDIFNSDSAMIIKAKPDKPQN